MTEKKTFKNVSSVINTFDPEHTWLVEGFRLANNTFTHREWDMEVTFTKKPKPVEVGSVVRHKNWPVWLDSGEPIYFVVKAIVDKQAWIGYKDQKREDMLASLDSLYFDE